MNKFLDNLKYEAESNPTVTLVVVTGLVASAAKLIEAIGNSRGSHAFAKDVNRRVRQAKKQ